MEVQVLSSAPYESLRTTEAFFYLLFFHALLLPFFRIPCIKGIPVIRVAGEEWLTVHIRPPIMGALVVAGWSSLVARRAHNP